jgi:hypothetical protein
LVLLLGTKCCLRRQPDSSALPRTLCRSKSSSRNITKAFYLVIKADGFVFELHHWVKQYKAERFPREPFPPPLPTEALLKRYHSHTGKYTSCRTALANIQLLKFWCITIALLALGSSPILGFSYI